jgi:hypothetical protein
VDDDDAKRDDTKRLDRKMIGFLRASLKVPAGFLRWLRGPSSRWIRVSIALLLIVGGVVGFLPVLGLWMVPLANALRLS